MADTLPNIRHMRVFLETVRTGSVSRAAELCSLSQPAATQALRRLEAETGASLLTRQTRNFSTTPSGALLADRIERALEHLAAGARASLRGARDGYGRRRSYDRRVTAAQLRTLIAVANTGSFTLAARALALSQPTVHRAARSLEDIAGVPFFRATSAGVELTGAALAFVTGAKLAQAEFRQAIEEIEHEQGLDAGTFNLGSLPLARTVIVPRAAHATVEDNPGFQIRVIDGRYAELLRSLREGDLDCLIGALRHPAPADDVTQEPLFMDELAIVAHPRHPLAGRRDVTLQETLAYPWVAPPKTTPAGSFLFETLRIDRQPVTPVRVVSSSLVMLRGILAEGDYVSIVSRHQIGVDQRAGHIVPLDVPLEGSQRAIGLTYRSAWRPTARQRRFLDHLRRIGAAAGPAPPAAVPQTDTLE